MRFEFMLNRSALAFAALLTSSTLALAANDPTGIWLDSTGRGAVEIKQCGNALCGHVVWVKDGADAKGCGKQIIGEAVKTGSNTWDNGWIYSPENKKNYDVQLKPLSDGTLQVTGYAGVKFLSKTMSWTRAPADLKRCGEQTAAIAPPALAKPNETTAPAPQVAPIPEKPAEKPAMAPSSTSTPTASNPSEAKTIEPKPIESKPAETTAVETKPTETKTSEPSVEKAPTPAPSSPVAEKEKPQTEAKSDDDDSDDGEKPGVRSEKKGLKGLKIGDIEIDKVFTKTKSGECKLDLPFVKVQFDCDKD